MRNFVVKVPGENRVIVHHGETLAEVLPKLLIGYEVVGEVLDGVTINPPLPDGLKHYTFCTAFLLQHGLELREWLEENGCTCRCAAPPVEAMDLESAVTAVATMALDRHGGGNNAEGAGEAAPGRSVARGQRRG